MSASSKKKLRSAERAEKLTQNQLAEQKEAKKLKIYTTVFVVVLALMICFAIVITAIKTVENSGIREKKTVALTLNDHEISSTEMNYFYIDTINNFYNQYGSYISLLGLDVTKPLDEQVLNGEDGLTWAQDFLNNAAEQAKGVYALNDAAAAAGFSLSEEDIAAVDASIDNLEFYAMYNFGYPDLETYLKAMYGNGADLESFRNYQHMNYLADAYQKNYAESLTYEDADLREAEADNYNAYTNYTYNYYYLNAHNLIEGEDTTNYTDEQYADAVALAEKYAKVITEDIKTVEEFDAAVATLPTNAEIAGAASYLSKDVSYSAIPTAIVDWVTDESRKAGEITYIANNTTSTDESGKETTTVAGYYAVMFQERNENNFNLVNVRHILVPFAGGTLDATGVRVYSDEEKLAAKTAAEELLKTWQNGEATEDSFAALANAESSDSDGTDGGLYTDIIPGEMVPNFNDWCFDASREAGDTGVVETEYGYHVMYFSGYSDITYRDYMIESELKTEDLNTWFEGLVSKFTSTLGDTKYIRTDLILGGNA